MEVKNQIKMTVQSISENVGIVRLTAAAFATQGDFTLNEIEEIKVAVSEAVSNSVIHGYGHQDGIIEFIMNLYADKIEFIIKDTGKGIEDINLARQPSYSSDPERMGLGFVFMESFMDELQIESHVSVGTTVKMAKKIPLHSAH